eukprot:gene18036-17883_t
MTVTDAEARRFDNDRVMGLINYGLLFSAIFFVGVPGIVAVILAYSQRGTAGPLMREHYRFQIQIFWIGLLLGLVAGISGLWAVLDVAGEAWRNGDIHGEMEPDELNLTGKVIGLFVTSAVALALMTLWSLAAPAVGFIRLRRRLRDTAPMTVPPLAAYPATRLRRLRQADWTRRMVRETSLQPADLIWSMVVHEGEGRIPVASMPGVERLSVAEAAEAAVEARELGIPCIAIFPHIDGARKDAEGSLAAEEEGVICRAIRAMKAAAPEVGIMCDVALDPFTTHGHDGVLKDGRIVNDATIERLVGQALVQARAGCDILAPSDMMDGRVGAIRAALEAEGLQDVMIMSYAAKYASAFYGPYRDAIGSGKLGSGDVANPGDKKTYQMDPANSDE